MRERATFESEISHLLSRPSYENPQSQGNQVKGGGATPGSGQGIDLIFIMKPLPGEEEEDQFTKDLTKYVKTVLRGQQNKEIYNVDDIIDHLTWIIWKSQGREKVRRIRIVAHGQKDMGGVKMALRTTKPTGGQSAKLESEMKFVLPSDVLKQFMNEPNRQVVRAVMTKDAVVEFWGCYIAGVPEAGSAWSSIFESTFRATSEEVMTGYHYYTLHRRTASLSQTPPSDRVHNTSEIDKLNKRVQEHFRIWLLERYREFVRNGDVLPVRGESNQINLMRDIFDSSDGDLKYLVVNIYLRGRRFQPGVGRKVRPGNPNFWSRVWKDFTFSI